jgi:hypothetical protein
MSIETRLRQAEQRAAQYMPGVPSLWDLSRLTAGEINTLNALAEKAGVPDRVKVEDLSDDELRRIAAAGREVTA